jgi:hypothetical protein
MTDPSGSPPAPDSRRPRRLLLWLLLLAILVVGVLVAYAPIPTPPEKRWESARQAITDMGCRVELLKGEATIDGCKDLDDAGLGQLSRHAQSFATVLLSLQGTQVDAAGLEHLKGLRNLRELNLSGLRLTDASLANLVGLPHLEELNLTRTDIGNEGLRHLAGLPALRRLLLNDDPGVGDEGLAHLAGLDELRDLRLNGTGVGDKGLLRLPDQLKKRETLWLKDTPKVTAEGIEGLKKKAPDLRVRGR